MNRIVCVAVLAVTSALPACVAEEGGVKPRFGKAPGLDTFAVGIEANNDGKTDTAVLVLNSDPTQPSQVKLWFNDGPDASGNWQGFRAMTHLASVGVRPSGIVTGSFNAMADAHEDLAVCNAGVTTADDGTVTILLNDSTTPGAFTASTHHVGGTPMAIDQGDLVGGDLVTDVLIADQFNNEIRIYRGNGDGTFEWAKPVKLDHGRGTLGRVRSKDVDTDKDLEVIGVHTTGSLGATGDVFVFKHQGNHSGNYDPPQFYTVGQGPTNLTFVDVDMDLVTDIVAVNAVDETISVLLNTEQGGEWGSFTVLPSTPAAGPRSSSLIGGNFINDSDGFADLVVADEQDHCVRIYEGDGTGAFTFFMRLDTGGNRPGRLEPQRLGTDLYPEIVGTNMADNSVFVLINDGWKRPPLKKYP